MRARLSDTVRARRRGSLLSYSSALSLSLEHTERMTEPCNAAPTLPSLAPPSPAHAPSPSCGATFLAVQNAALYVCRSVDLGLVV